MQKLAMGLRSTLRRLLSDGEYHAFGEIYEKVESIMTPESASRYALATKRAGARYYGYDVPADIPAECDFERLIRMGRRSMLYRALSYLRCEHFGYGVGGQWRRPPTRACAYCRKEYWPGVHAKTGYCSGACANRARVAV